MLFYYVFYFINNYYFFFIIKNISVSINFFKYKNKKIIFSFYSIKI